MSARRPFEIIRSPSDMRTRAEDMRRDGLRLCLVPTMGYLHEGHLSLLRAGRARADVLMLSIFVNPTQFAAGEDLGVYPRDEAGDLAKARSCGVDLAFCPDPETMYSPGFQTYVEVRDLQQPMCGVSRPSHFRGVATVVAKLFHLTQPHLAIFGQKDYQQLAVIRRMVEDLHFGIEVMGMPIVREPDGLALSSRNAYLSADERLRGLSLSRGLRAAEQKFLAGERDPARLIEVVRDMMAAESVRLDYVELRDAASLEPVSAGKGASEGTAGIARPVVLAVAAYVGATRLIDNVILTPS